MPLVYKCHLPSIQAANGARCLGRPKVEPVTERGHQISFRWVLQLRIIAGDRPKMLGPVEPLLGIREGFQYTDRFHTLFQELLETLEAGGFGFAAQPFQSRLAAL